MRKVLIALIGLIFYHYCYSQTNCKTALENYPKTIDTSKRPIYQIVDIMPDIMTGSKLMELLLKKFPQIDDSKCFPTYIYYGFVVEADCTIMNVMICPTLAFCEDNEKIDLIKQEYIKRLTAEIIKIKTSAGLLKGKKVAVYTSGRIHFDSQ